MTGLLPSKQPVSVFNLRMDFAFCGRRYLAPTIGAARKGGTCRLSGQPGPRDDEGDSFRPRLSYGEPGAGQAWPSVFEGMATWVQAVNTPDGFWADGSQGTAVELDPGVERFWSRRRR